MDDMHKLAHLIEHWMEHNQDHRATYSEWAAKAQSAGKTEAASLLTLVSEEVKKIDALFARALESLK